MKFKNDEMPFLLKVMEQVKFATGETSPANLPNFVPLICGLFVHINTKPTLHFEKFVYTTVSIFFQRLASIENYCLQEDMDMRNYITDFLPIARTCQWSTFFGTSKIGVVLLGCFQSLFTITFEAGYKCI